MLPCWAIGIFAADIDRFVHIRRVDEDEAAEMFLGFGERSVGGRCFAATNSHCTGGAYVSERIGNQVVTASAQLLVIGQ